jgi:hypothetical protein
MVPIKTEAISTHNVETEASISAVTKWKDMIRKYQHSVRGVWEQEMSALSKWGMGTGDVNTQ